MIAELFRIEIILQFLFIIREPHMELRPNWGNLFEASSITVRAAVYLVVSIEFD